MGNCAEVASIDAWGDRVESALRASDPAAARAAADQARAMASNPHDKVRTTLWQARCDYVVGNLEAAVPLVLEAGSGAEALADAGLEAIARALLSRCLLAAGDPQEALEHALAAARLVESADTAEAGTLLRPRLLAATALGVVYLNLRALDSALDFCKRAAECAQALGDQVALGAAIDTVACVHAAVAARERAEGHAALAERWEREAMRCSDEAVRIAREQGHREYEATALNNLAESMSMVGEATQALELLEVWEQRNPFLPPGIRSHHFDTRGSICLALNRPVEARSWFERALVLAESLVSKLVVSEHLAQALEQCGEWQAALAQYKRFHELHLQVSAERAQRSARVAAVRLGTERSQARAEMLTRRNAHLQRRTEDLQRLSREDPLTGLANRRRLEELLHADPKGCCIALLDVDHFKQVNDGYSHAVGDEVLRCLAGLLRQGCRDADTPARLGGEEFVALLRRVTPAAAQAAAERLRRLVEAHDWSAVAPGLAITVSIGVAHGDEAEDGDALLALADRRLYVAKRGGRNRVVCSG